MWHHAVPQCRGIEDVETGKKHCVNPTARYPSKFHFDHLTNNICGLLIPRVDNKEKRVSNGEVVSGK